MLFINAVVSALLLVAQAELIVAKALIHDSPFASRRNHHAEIKRAAMDALDNNILPREPQATSTGSISPETANTNTTITDDCISALSSISVTNPAGLGACYNILAWDNSSATFQADLRFYLMGQARGSFKQVPVNAMTINLAYPQSTTFKPLMKRRRRDLIQRSNMIEVQQSSLLGSIQSSYDVAKLNSTELMALMVPTFSVQASTGSGTVSANVSSSDAVYFVSGVFQNDFSAAAVSPGMVSTALTAALPFVLPGTTLGIFPTGLIVTGAWTVLFFLAFGLGTFWRIQHRSIYRKRMAASNGGRGKK